MHPNGGDDGEDMKMGESKEGRTKDVDVATGIIWLFVPGSRRACFIVLHFPSSHVFRPPVAKDNKEAHATRHSVSGVVETKLTDLVVQRKNSSLQKHL